MKVRWWPAGATLAVALAGWAALAGRREASRLLWYEGRPVKWAGERGVVLAADGDLLEVRRGLHLTRLDLAAGTRTFLDVAPRADGGLWLADGAGQIAFRSRDGALRDVGRTPFDLAALSAAGPSLWAVRSSRQFTYKPEDDAAPLAVRLDSALRVTGRAGTVRVPDNPFLTQLTNAAQVLGLADGDVVIAPFTRDEVLRYGPDGRLRWRAERGLSQATPNPVMLTRRSANGAPSVVVDYVPVNLGLAEGPDGTLYVLSTVAARTDSSRLDALDPLSGRLRRTWRFASALPTLALAPSGDVVMADLRVDPGAGPERFAAFSVPAPGGDSLRLKDFSGRVVVVNFWASWCAPCRDEFPALDSLAATYDTARVTFVALSDDVARGGAERFLALHPARHLRVGFGGGRLKDRYHYVGLPTTTVLDGSGRIRARWVGYAGPGQIAGLADSIARLESREPLAHHHGS